MMHCIKATSLAVVAQYRAYVLEPFFRCVFNNYRKNHRIDLRIFIQLDYVKIER